VYTPGFMDQDLIYGTTVRLFRADISGGTIIGSIPVDSHYREYLPKD